MWRYVVRRLLILIPVIICVAIVIFSLLYFTPGDPAEAVLGSNATQEQLDQKREELGLDQPYVVQLGRFLVQLFIHGDLGTSYMDGTSVMSQLLLRLPRTALIAVMVMLIQVVFGIPLGISAATHKDKWQDTFCILVAMVTTSFPGFWLALILVLFFSLKLNWLPSSGVTSWTCYILPCIAAGLSGIGQMGRMTRSQMLEVKNADYCVTARAQGISEHTILYRHALPNALIPIITSAGTHFGAALGGSIVIETVFAIPGVGTYIMDAINSRDYPVVRGGVVILAIMFCLVMLLVDLGYAFIDPRIKAQYEQKRTRKVRGK
jgi:peptide/nickel transport system permease protein